MPCSNHNPMDVNIFYVGSECRPSFLVDPAMYGDLDNARADVVAAEQALRILDVPFVRDPARSIGIGRAPDLPTWREWRPRLVELRTRYAFFVGDASSEARHRRPDCVILGARYDHPDAVLEAVRLALGAVRQLSDGCVIETTLIHKSDSGADAPSWDEFAASVSVAEPGRAATHLNQ